MYVFWTVWICPDTVARVDTDQRSDVVRNRARLLSAARRMFAEFGPDVPFDRIAADAGLSRTTLHRHFANRDELAAVLFQENVADIEAAAARASASPDGLSDLFHFTLQLQLGVPGFARILSRSDVGGFSSLAERVAAAFSACLPGAERSGLLHPGVGVEDILIAFPMADAAVIEDRIAGRPDRSDRLHGLLHRALFATAEPERCCEPGGRGD